MDEGSGRDQSRGKVINLFGSGEGCNLDELNRAGDRRDTLAVIKEYLEHPFNVCGLKLSLLSHEIVRDLGCNTAIVLMSKHIMELTRAYAIEGCEDKAVGNVIDILRELNEAAAGRSTI